MPSLVQDHRKQHSQLMHKNWSYHLDLSWVKMDSNPLQNELLWNHPLRITGVIAGKKLCQTLICIWENDKWKFERMKTNELSNIYILPPISLRVKEIAFRNVYCGIQIRKMMSSATMTWLSSCMRAKADRTSGSVKRVWRPLLMSSIRFFIFTDCAWADWNTANSEDLNSFSLLEQSSRDIVTLHVSV